jgi:hypothetical protein
LNGISYDADLVVKFIAKALAARSRSRIHRFDPQNLAAITSTSI